MKLALWSGQKLLDTSMEAKLKSGIWKKNPKNQSPWFARTFSIPAKSTPFPYIVILQPESETTFVTATKSPPNLTPTPLLPHTYKPENTCSSNPFSATYFYSEEISRNSWYTFPLCSLYFSFSWCPISQFTQLTYSLIHRTLAAFHLVNCPWYSSLN